MIGHSYLTLYPSRLFFMSSMYTPEINLSLREKTWDLRLLDVLPISPTSNRQKLCIHLPLFTVKSKVFTFRQERPNTVKDLLSLNTVSQKDETCIPQGWMIPQYRTLKSKLPEYRLKKNLNTATPQIPMSLSTYKYLSIPYRRLSGTRSGSPLSESGKKKIIWHPRRVNFFYFYEFEGTQRSFGLNLNKIK